MSIVVQPIPSLYGGVSQQSAVNRSPIQCEEAINCGFSIADGAYKRPPLELVTELVTGENPDAFTAWGRHRNGDWFLLILPGDGTYRLHKVSTGEQLTEDSSTGGSTYLTCDGPAWKAFRAIATENSLYVVNREIMVAMTSDTTAGSIQGTVQTLQDEDLDSAPADSIWEVLGHDTAQFASYYVKHIDGKWVEWVRPDIPYKLDAATMPHRFDILEDGSAPEGYVYEYHFVDWGERKVGDTDSNKAPSFVGRSINGISFDSDRLVLISGRGASMSRVDDYTNFWRSTVTDVLADDRIDVKVNEDQISGLNWLANVSGFSVLFAGNRQFTLEGDPALTPSTVNVNPVTAYPASVDVTPVVSGPNVFFASNAGQYTHLRELYVEEDTVTLDAANVSSHVPKYIPSDLRALEMHNHYNHILAVSENNPEEMWSYQYDWSGNEKNISAWGRWHVMGGVKIMDMKQIDQWMYVVYQSTGSYQGLYLGRFDLKTGTADPGFNHKVHLDQVIRLTGQYDDVEDRTLFTSMYPLFEATDLGPAIPGQFFNDWGDGQHILFQVDVTPESQQLETGDWFVVEASDPDIEIDGNQYEIVAIEYEQESAIGIRVQGTLPSGGHTGGGFDIRSMGVAGERVRIVYGDGWENRGRMVPPYELSEYDANDDFSFYLDGDWTQGEMYLGLAYDKVFRFSEQYYTEGETRALTYRVQLRDMQVHFTNTAYFNVWVKSRGREANTLHIFPHLKSTYTSRVLNDEWFQLNTPEQTTGVYNFPVLGKASDTTIELRNDSYMPSAFQAAEWRGLVSQRMTR